jgi:hypothetical protein
MVLHLFGLPHRAVVEDYAGGVDERDPDAGLRKDLLQLTDPFGLIRSDQLVKLNVAVRDFGDVIEDNLQPGYAVPLLPLVLKRENSDRKEDEYNDEIEKDLSPERVSQGVAYLFFIRF